MASRAIAAEYKKARRQVQLEEEEFERWDVALDARRVGGSAALRQERQEGALRPQQRRQGLSTSQARVAGDADDCGRGHQEARPRKNHFHGNAEEQRNEGTSVFQKRHFQIQKTSRKKTIAPPKKVSTARACPASARSFFFIFGHGQELLAGSQKRRASDNRPGRRRAFKWFLTTRVRNTRSEAQPTFMSLFQMHSHRLCAFRSCGK